MSYIGIVISPGPAARTGAYGYRGRALTAKKSKSSAKTVPMRALEQKVITISSGRPDAGLEVKPQDVLQVLEAQVGDFAS